MEEPELKDEISVCEKREQTGCVCQAVLVTFMLHIHFKSTTQMPTSSDLLKRINVDSV